MKVTSTNTGKKLKLKLIHSYKNTFIEFSKSFTLSLTLDFWDSDYSNIRVMWKSV